MFLTLFYTFLCIGVKCWTSVSEARYQVFTAVKIEFTVLGVVVPCSTVVIYHSRGLYCFHLHSWSAWWTGSGHRQYKSMNREEGFSLSKSWKPFIWTLNDCRKDLSRHKWLFILSRAYYSTLFPHLYSICFLLSLLILFFPSSLFVSFLQGPFPPTLPFGSCIFSCLSFL